MCIKILMLGNGFDLANNLPTTYNNFMEFCKYVSYIFQDKPLDKSNNEYSEKYLNSWKFDHHIKEMLNNAFYTSDYKGTVLQTETDALNELFECIKENLWYDYFQVLMEENKINGITWIDFESTISICIRELDCYRKEISEKNGRIDPPQIFAFYEIVRNIKFQSSMGNEEIDQMISILYNDLNRLTRALEIYLSVFVGKLPTEKISDLKNNHFTYILSFNYTDTFVRNYKSNLENDYDICYVHGKASADATIETCNLILGIDEYLKGNKKNVDLDFLTFKKFYQRIFKQTDNNYSIWLDRIHKLQIDGRTRAEKFELHIFGHSLDITDKDILKAFILNDNVQTKIYYYLRNENDKLDFSNKIKNLIKIIGQKEVIARTGGGSKNTIEFIAQEI